MTAEWQYGFDVSVEIERDQLEALKALCVRLNMEFADEEEYLGFTTINVSTDNRELAAQFKLEVLLMAMPAPLHQPEFN